MSGSPKNHLGSVRSDMDIAYPEHLSRLHRHSVLAGDPKSFLHAKKTARNRRGNRYRTQPVTFDEIQEVDEEASEDTQAPARCSTAKLQLEFFQFSKALDSRCSSKPQEPPQEGAQAKDNVQKELQAPQPAWTGRSGRETAV